MGYTNRELAARTGRRTNTINYYVREKIIIPDIEPRGGRGKPMVFSDRNLVEVKMIEIMARMGVNLELASMALSTLRKGTWTPPDALLQGLHEDPEQAVKRVKAEAVNFGDFWTSGEWGKTKDLAFIWGRDVTEDDEPAGEMWVEVCRRKSTDEGFALTKAFDLSTSVVTILCLGSIKRRAEALLY